MENLKNYKNYFIPAIIFLVILFTGLVFLSPNLIKVIQIQKRINSERSILAQLTGKLSQLQAIDENGLTSKTEVLLKIIPPEKDVSVILSSLKNLSSISNLNLKGVQLDPGDLANDNQMLISLKLEGPVEGLKQFLEKIKLASPLMRPKSITTSYQESGNEMDLVLETFFLAFPQTLGAVDSPLPEISPDEEKVYQKASSFELPSSEVDNSLIQPSGKENPFSF